MPELSLAIIVVEKVLAHQRRRPGSRVLVVRLVIGEWICVQAEQLSFCYRAITTRTLIKDSELEIGRVAGAVRCPLCGYAGAPRYWNEAQWIAPVPTLTCPQCQRTAEPTAGHECAIRAIRYAA